MSNLFADLRFARRTLTRSPWFTLLAVVILAVGIGGTTALFSLVNAVLLNPLPYKDPHRIVEIWGRTDQRTGMRVPGAILEALRARSKTLAVIGTHDPSGGVLNNSGSAIDIRGETVAANFTEVYGVPPIAGRGFAPDDERTGSPAVMLVSFAFWQQFLGGDSDALGRSVLLDTVPYTVVGIMPPDFRTTFQSFSPQFWTPFAGNRSREREKELGYEVVARLATGATVEQARSEIDAIASSVQVEGWREAGHRLGLVPLKDEVIGDRAYALTLMMYASVLVLVVACANLAQLLLVRSDRRMTEFATRKAIGADFQQLFRLALSESLLLSALGGAAGVAIAYWLVPVVVALAPHGDPAPHRRFHRHARSDHGCRHQRRHRLPLRLRPGSEIVASLGDPGDETGGRCDLKTAGAFPVRARGRAGRGGRHAVDRRRSRRPDIPHAAAL